MRGYSLRIVSCSYGGQEVTRCPGRPREAGGGFQSECKGLKIRGADVVSPHRSLEARAPGVPISEGRRQCPRRAKEFALPLPFCSTEVLCLLGDAHLLWGRQTSLTPLMGMSVSSGDTAWTRPGIMCGQLSGTPWCGELDTDHKASQV